MPSNEPWVVKSSQLVSFETWLSLTLKPRACSWLITGCTRVGLWFHRPQFMNGPYSSVNVTASSSSHLCSAFR